VQSARRKEGSTSRSARSMQAYSDRARLAWGLAQPGSTYNLVAAAIVDCGQARESGLLSLLAHNSSFGHSAGVASSFTTKAHSNR